MFYHVNISIVTTNTGTSVVDDKHIQILMCAIVDMIKFSEGLCFKLLFVRSLYCHCFITVRGKPVPLRFLTWDRL